MKITKYPKLTLTLLAATLPTAAAYAQLPYAGSGQVHVETFNWTTGGTQQNLTWQQNVERQSWAREGTSQIGWYASFTNPPTSFAITNGTANNGGGMLSNFFFTSTEENRSLGGRPTGGAGPLILALRLRNEGSTTLTEFTISYALAVTQQRNAAVSNTATFAYRLGGTERKLATAVFTAPGASFNATTPLVQVSANVNGSLPANRGTVVEQTISGIEWEPGQDLWLRWTVPNVAEGPNVGLDDVVFVARNPAVLIPPPPGNVRVAQVGDDVIRVQWDDQLTDEDGYIVERSTQPDTGFVEVANLPANSSVFNDTTTAVNVTYYYRVRALRSGQLSDPSTVVSIARFVGPPAPPVEVSVRVVSSVSALIRWQDNSFNETGFVIERATEGGEFVEVGRVPSGRLTFTDSPILPETQYTYRVAAYNIHGNSIFVELAPVVTPATPLQFGFGPPPIADSEIGQIVYVSATHGDNTRDGLTAETSVRTIERAVDIAKQLNAQNIGVKILLAPGVYLEGDPNRDVDFGAVNLNGYFTTTAPLVIQGQGWEPGVNTGDVVLTGAERWTNWSAADANGIHTAPWPYKWGLNPRAQAVAPDTIKRFELIWVYANGEWRNYIQMDNASDPRNSNSGA
ncbi:MAG: fibronectin type III domain-containing protein [Verrucomicrobia bacterium]|nr:fibronectin type III domain-containing protein [Verrucomicrobiota bacterium]